jgi:hypothetical protein
MSNKTILLISFLVPMIIGTAAGGMGYLQRYGNPLPPWLGAREIIFGLLGIALLFISWGIWKRIQASREWSSGSPARIAGARYIESEKIGEIIVAASASNDVRELFPMGHISTIAPRESYKVELAVTKKQLERLAHARGYSGKVG